MHLYTILLVFSTLTSRLHPGCAGSFSACKPTLKRFQKVPHLDDRTVAQDTLATETVKSDVDCGRRCARVEGCVMFTSLSGQSGNHPGECRMYGQPTQSLTGSENSPGARSYRLTDSSKKSDNGYFKLGDLNLMVINISHTFWEAKDFCQQLDNGHLAIPRTLDDLTLFQSVMPRHCDFVWLGADDQAMNGTFVWHNGSTLPVDSPLWGQGQPDGSGGVCYRVGNRLFDCLCTTKRCALCQKDAVC